VDRVEDRPQDLTAPAAARAPVAIVGGGWAGCAAAVTLADAGVPVILFEAAPTLGGRARRVAHGGFVVDNGQHLMLGAYRETLALLRVVCGPEAALPVLRRPIAILPFASARGDALALAAPRAPGRLGLAIALLTARGLTWRERLANVRFMRALERTGYARPGGETVKKMLAPLPLRVVQGLWEPLCLASLNTPIATASAQVFANVLRAAFGTRGDDSDFVLPAVDLSAMFPERAARHLRARGGTSRLGERAQVVAAGRGGVTLAVGTPAAPCAAAAVIVAVGPHQLAAAFAPEALAAHPPLAGAIDALSTMAFEPIVTVYLGYARRIALPAPLSRLDDAPGQWIVDRPDALGAAVGKGNPAVAQVLSVVISASGPHMALPHDALVQAVDGQLRRLRSDIPPLAWSYVIAEKRATYACTPRRPRVAGPRLAPGVYVCGDYVDAEFPATLEAAVRSGIAAARAVIADAP